MAERKTDIDYEMEAQQLDYLQERKPRFVEMIINLNEYKTMGMSPEEYQQALNSMQSNYDMPDSFLREVLEAGNKAYQESRQPKAEGSLMTPREGYLVGGQKKLDMNKDGEISGEDFSLLRDRKAEGSEVYPEEPKLKEKNKFIFDRAVELIEAGKASGLDIGMRMATVEANEKFGSDRDLMSPERRGEMDKNIKRHLEMMEMLKEREKKLEGGMPVDTYPNIPPDQMAEVEASQLPDNDMEEEYIKFVMDQSLTDEEQDYLAGAIDKDPKLSSIMDKVITTASEFSGAGEVDGPGTGVSDSIPARLSDGEFVITKNATDQLGADNLQRMMDDAERAYDGGYQMKAMGGMMDEEKDPEVPGMSKTKEEIEKLMMGANRMPSLQ